MSKEYDTIVLFKQEDTDLAIGYVIHTYSPRYYGGESLTIEGERKHYSNYKYKGVYMKRNNDKYTCYRGNSDDINEMLTSAERRGIYVIMFPQKNMEAINLFLT